MIAIEIALVAAAVLLLFSILASKAFDRLGIPALLLFLVIGMLAGSEGPGGIYFDDPALAQLIGIISLILILFSGGLDTEWREVRPVLKESLLLATLGVFITQEAALFRFASAWAAIFSACIMGISLYLLILLAERLAMPWHSSFRK